MWDPQWQTIQDAGYRTVRCDFRGFGETPAATEPFNGAEDVLDLLDALGETSTILVGSSFGGRIAQEVAARWPDRVSTLILLCPATRLHPPTPAIRAFSDREDELLAAGDIEGAIALNVETFLGPAASAETREAVAGMQRLAFEIQIAADAAAPDVDVVRNVDFDLSAVTARTTVVSGALDVDYFRSTAVFLAETIPGATLLELPWAGHLPSLEDPKALNPLLIDLLNAV